MHSEDMFNTFRNDMYYKYSQARKDYIDHPEKLIKLEKFMTGKVRYLIESHLDEIVHDFNEASYLSPFWAEYPPLDRGRGPRGDQTPWIEVGEQAVGEKIKRYAAEAFEQVDDIAIPDGPDHRIGVKDSGIKRILQNTDSAMLFLDSKTVGPRDDKDEVVASPNQVSGNGRWNSVLENVTNDSITAKGKRASQDFQPALSPIIVDSAGTIRPVVLIFVKPVYSMNNQSGGSGQPLEKLKLITVPNGLLLTQSPNYVQQYKDDHLFYPGKDDKSTNILKRRARINAIVLKEIADWRYQVIDLLQ